LPKYIVHVGPPKTGSKFLQSQLFHARGELLEHGICYPGLWWRHEDEVMHEPLRECIRRGEVAGLRAQFAALNEAGHRIVVLSCEGFDNLNERELTLLRQAIGDNPIDIVYYCRRWSELIPSVWRMRIMMGRYPTFPEHFAAYFADPTGMGGLNWSLVWRRFESVFGRQSLRLVPFSHLRRAKVDLFAHFCATFLDLDRPPVVDQGLIQRNISPDPEEIEILRALNYLHYVETGRLEVLMRVKFLALRRRLDLKPLADLMVGEYEQCRIRDDADAWKASWAAMSAYEDRLVGTEYGRHLFDLKPTNAPVTYVRANYLLKPKALDLLSHLFAFLNATPVSDPQLRRVTG
jgi:hypothetical protein